MYETTRKKYAAPAPAIMEHKGCSTQNTSTRPESMTSNFVDAYTNNVREDRVLLGPITKNRKNLEMPPPPDVIQAIDAKINELKSYFQDYINVLDDKQEDTTIIEFAPNVLSPNVMKTRNVSEPFDKHIQKYQKMRNKIKMTLENEKVSKKAKKMVIKTIDEMIGKLVSSQCNWNEKQKQILRTGEGHGNCHFNNITLTKDECRSIVLQYFAAVKTMNETNNEPEINFSEDFHQTADSLKKFFKELWQNQSLLFLNKFTNTVSDVINDAQSLSDKYKVKCSLVEIDRETRRTNCEGFKLCTDEFREYLSEFYKHLNDTTVSAFRNYAAMYVRDVNSDASEEKVSVIKTINDLSYKVEHPVQEAFIKYTSKIKLTKSKHHNIKAIKEYVRQTTRHIKKHVKKLLEENSTDLKEKLYVPVKNDININLDVDLGNLESTFLGRTCTFFVTCNGEIGMPPRKGFNSTHSNLDPRSVYVKVELTLDDELKDSLERSFQNSNLRRNNINHVNIKPSKSFNKVTRTTLANIATTEPHMKIFDNLKQAF